MPLVLQLQLGDGSSVGTISSGTGIQKGQRVVGDGVPDDTFVHDITGTHYIE